MLSQNRAIRSFHFPSFTTSQAQQQPLGDPQNQDGEGGGEDEAGYTDGYEYGLEDAGGDGAENESYEGDDGDEDYLPEIITISSTSSEADSATAAAPPNTATPTMPTEPQTSEADSPPLTRQQLNALFDYESALSRLYRATYDGIWQIVGARLDISAGESTTDIYDPITRWAIACELMASFARLDASQIVAHPPVYEHHGHPLFQTILSNLWLVVENGDREALRELDSALRGGREWPSAVAGTWEIDDSDESMNE